MAKTKTKLTLEPSVLNWARLRARLEPDELAAKIGVQVGTLKRWEEKGEISPVQVRKLADKTHTPFGYLFLRHPPEDRLPIADFRARQPDQHRYPSVELLDTISSMQRRQDWLHEELIRLGTFPCGLVGSFGTNSAIREAADVIRKEVDLAPDWAGNTASWSEAQRQLIGAIETAGVFVVVNGIVGNNTSRQLDPEEFLGFALVDKYAPMIFVNGADFIASQNFSLVHELVHICIGKTGLSADLGDGTGSDTAELFCNRIAAEYLVPVDSLARAWDLAGSHAGLPSALQELARTFKVSEAVVVRKLHSDGLIGSDTVRDFFRGRVRRPERPPSSKGGNFRANQRYRLGNRFASLIVPALHERRLGYREARLLTDLKGDIGENLTVHLGHFRCRIRPVGAVPLMPTS